MSNSTIETRLNLAKNPTGGAGCSVGPAGSTAGCPPLCTSDGKQRRVRSGHALVSTVPALSHLVASPSEEHELDGLITAACAVATVFLAASRERWVSSHHPTDGPYALVRSGPRPPREAFPDLDPRSVTS